MPYAIKEALTMIDRSCSVCELYAAEEVGDSDYGPTYADFCSCRVEHDVVNDVIDEQFDRSVTRGCCVPSFWLILEQDAEVRRAYDVDVSLNDDKLTRSIELFMKRYIRHHGEGSLEHEGA